MTYRDDQHNKRRARRRRRQRARRLLRYSVVFALGVAATLVATGTVAVPVPGDNPGVGAASSPTDSDGDGLPDAWEEAGETPGGTPLPDANPDHKDLYLQIYRSQGVEKLSNEEINELKAYWETMAVESPALNDGVDIHIVYRSELQERVQIQASAAEFERLYESRFRDRMPERCVYHTVALVDVRGSYAAGRSQSPGYFSVVDGTPSNDPPDYRVTTMTHELLHNIVGPVNGEYHTDSGWLSTEYGDQTLSPAVERQLSRDGFNTTDAVAGCRAP